MEDAPGPQAIDDSPRAPCRYCGEVVLVAAKKCRFCGEWLDDTVREQVRARGRDPAVDAPIVLKLWGGLTMALAGIMLVLQVVQMIYTVITFASVLGVGILTGMGVSMAISIAIYLVVARLGWGLWRGQRVAVAGYGVLGLLGLLPVVVVGVDGKWEALAVALAIWTALFAPPLVVGVTSWKRLN